MVRPSYDIVAYKALEYVLGLRSIGRAKDAVWEAYDELEVRCSKTCGKDITVLILTAPCYGFGDIVFAIKLGKYMREWYGCDVTFMTTHAEGFVKMGEPMSNVLPLATSKGRTECRRFGRLKPTRQIPAADLVFVAPVPTEYDADLGDVKKLVPFANMFNTFFFSEYNHQDNSGVDFPTGVGGKHAGIFLNPMRVAAGRPAKLKNPFALAYLADSVPESKRCLYAFMEMVAAKYNKKHNKLDIVVPRWVCEDMDIFSHQIVKKVGKYYHSIAYIGTQGSKEWLKQGDGRKVFTIRCDVLPVANKEMVRLIKASVPDILLTGDQSLSDALSCCVTKNIWYQIAPWKDRLGRALAKHLPQKYYSKKSTACGTLKALNYKSGFSKFVDKWSFKQISKHKLDAVVLAAKARKNSAEIQAVEKLISSARTLGTMKRRIREMI